MTAAAVTAADSVSVCVCVCCVVVGQRLLQQLRPPDQDPLLVVQLNNKTNSDMEIFHSGTALLTNPMDGFPKVLLSSCLFPNIFGCLMVSGAGGGGG